MSTRYLAHISEDGREQTVREHLENTAALSAGFAKSFGMEEQGRLIGLAHDIGKCSEEFQQRLRGGHIVDHATAGALECAKLDPGAIWAACCVAGHHGGLPDVGNMFNDMSGDPTLFGRIKKGIKGDIPRYENPEIITAVPKPQGYGENKLTDSFITRMLYSCLVDADFLDTENFMSNGLVERGTGEPLPVLLERLGRFVEPWWNPKEELKRLRCEILKDCIEKGKSEKGLFSLTVPTGGGKTISSMAFALNHAVANRMDRIIYVIPYTSIIEQTAEVFRAVFGEENVVEHHSAASFEIGDEGMASRYKLLRSTENWDAPIVVTTAVQFFESVFSNRSSKCRKLHNTANSVIIFDEAQMLPTAHLRPCVAAIAKLVSNFGSTAVLCTATQPSLNDLFHIYAPGMTIREIAPNVKESFAKFERVRFRVVGTWSIDTLADALSEKMQVLCIVNSRKSAKEVYEQLPAEGSYHLSTLMYPMHRKQVLSEIRERLRSGSPCRVVSTSLIEAGVDVDFPFVFREKAGLDSILQAAGRCNREGKRAPEESIVTVFEGVSKTPQLLRVNIGAANEALKDGAEIASLETIDRYFKTYRSLAGERLDQSGIIDGFTHGISGCELPFRTVAEHFHLIDDATKTIYVPIGKGEEYVKRLDEGESSRKLFRELGKYSVNVYEKHFQGLMKRGALRSVDENSAVLTDLEVYDPHSGLLLEETQETAVFI